MCSFIQASSQQSFFYLYHPYLISFCTPLQAAFGFPKHPGNNLFMVISGGHR